jgi:hypothetical protein
VSQVVDGRAGLEPEIDVLFLEPLGEFLDSDGLPVGIAPARVVRFGIGYDPSICFLLGVALDPGSTCATNQPPLIT